MNLQPRKFIIGLTGNIATGKSIVRKMLEQTGAFGIDADSLAHHVIKPDASGYLPVLEEFGETILNSNGEINRSRLGGIVFNDPDSLRKLEEIIHPLVREKIHELVGGTPFSYIVIEAIKLFESGLSSECDTIWVCNSSKALQTKRLMESRGMDRSIAQARIQAQPPQSQKTEMADVIIDNHGSCLQTWGQVRQAWKEILLESRIQVSPSNPARFNGIVIYRCDPDDTEMVLDLLSRFNKNRNNSSPPETSVSLFKKNYLVISEQIQELALIAWESDNFTIRATEFYFNADKLGSDLLYNIIKEIDKFWQFYRPESLLIHLPEKIKYVTSKLQHLGYEEIHPGEGYPGEGSWPPASERDNTGIWLVKKCIR